MALTKREVVRHTIEDNGVIFEVKTTVIEEDGVKIAESSPHKSTFEPDEDTTKLDGRVKAIADAVWTKDVIEKRKKEVADAIRRATEFDDRRNVGVEVKRG